VWEDAEGPEDVDNEGIMYLWCNAVHCGIHLRAYRRNVLLPSSGYQSLFTYSSSLNIEAEHSSETLVNSYNITRLDIPEEIF
jgi:hypothetical protein